MLSSSVNLPAGTEQTMLVLSDLSGHDKVSYFDEYITAYPLNEIGFYALAKTWYASEMSRPGCVWTQTLLIPFALLASTCELQAFAYHFNRPTGGEFASFCEPLPAKSPEHSTRPDRGRSLTDVSMGASILFRLYESPSTPVLVPVKTPAEIEDTFFAIWAQQWPRLRRSFAFCTGSIAGRRLGKGWFDLQAVPSKRISELSRTIDGASIAPADHGHLLSVCPPWWKAALDDLENPQRGGLREFLFDFGAETGGGRSAFSHLVNMYINLTTRDVVNESAAKLVNSLETIFPDSDQGAKIKQRLLSWPLTPSSSHDAVWRLELLLHAKKGTFNLQAADIIALVKDAWARDPIKLVNTLELALQSNKKPSPAVLSAMAMALQPTDLVGNADNARAAIMALASHRPILLADSAFREFESRNSILVEHVSKSGTTASDIRRILKLWIEENDFLSLQESVTREPQRVVSALLDILASDEDVLDRFDGKQWKSILSADNLFLIEWIRANNKKVVSDKLPLRVVALALLSVAPKMLPFDKISSNVWAHLLSNLEALDSMPELLKDVTLFLYQEAMRNRSEQGARIATLAFPYIYQLPLRHDLSRLEWSQLRHTLGDSDWYWDWDYCRRLREGLIDHFMKFSWPIKYFEDMVNSNEVGSSILKSSYYKSRHRRFMKQIKPPRECRRPF